jgi:DNA-binding response OmpR family regulator
MIPELRGTQYARNREAATGFSVRVFEVIPHTRELRKHGVKLKLQDQLLPILLLLLEQPAKSLPESRFRSASGLRTRMSSSIARSTAQYGKFGTP